MRRDERENREEKEEREEVAFSLCKKSPASNQQMAKLMAIIAYTCCGKRPPNKAPKNKTTESEDNHPRIVTPAVAVRQPRIIRS